MPDTPGWGITPNEEALRAHPPKSEAGLLDYGRKP
jgi:L-alanine-DL-glutamate epimerase-like enolase superfamily enzyme